MPVIPEYTAQQGLDIGSTPTANVDGGAIGQGMGQIGQGLTQVADAAERYQRLQLQKSQFQLSQNLDLFNQQQAGKYEDAKNNAPVNGDGFHTSWMQQNGQAQKDFLATVPPELQQEAQSRLAITGEQWANKSADDERTIGGNYVTNSLTQNYNTYKNAIVRDPNAKDAAQSTLFQQIDVAPYLSNVTKASLKRGVENGLQVEQLKALAGSDPNLVRQFQGLPPQGQAAQPGAGVPANANPQLAALDQKYSLPPGYLERTMMIESGGKDVANAQGSGAQGPFQFIPSTAARLGVDPHDFTSSADGAARLAQEGVAALTPVLGRAPTAGELYLAHQQGAAGAAKLLANPNAPAASIVGTKAVIQNGGTQGMTAGDFANMWTSKFGNSSLPSYAQAAANQNAPGIPGQTSAPPLQPDPRFSTVTPDQWTSVFNDARQQQSQNMAISKGQLEPQVQDATNALMTNGKYDGQLPTQQQFVQAYGPVEGSQRFGQFQQVVQVGKEIDGYKTMTPAQISADVQAAQPIGDGPGFAMAQSRYEAVQKAASQTLALRAADPAKYVQATSPGIAAQWSGTNASTPQGYSTALATMAAAQTNLGIAPQDQKLLPDAYAKNIVTQYQNTDAPFATRSAAITNAVLRTQDPQQQQVIFQQLVKAGLPPSTEGAIEAYARGDTGAGDRLMTAATTDFSKLPQASEDVVKKADLDNAIATQVMGPSQIGGLSYGIQYGGPDNVARAQAGADLMQRAVRMRMAQGETDVSKAVTGAAADMFGTDNQVLNRTFNGMNFAGIIPTGTDLGVVERGVSAIKPIIQNAILTSASALNDKIANGDPQRQMILASQTQNYAYKVLNNGEITNYGQNGFVFMDPYTNKAVSGADGKPIVFTLGDIQAADKATQIPPPEQSASQTPQPALAAPAAAPVAQPQPGGAVPKINAPPLEQSKAGGIQSQIQELRKNQTPDSSPFDAIAGAIGGQGL